MKQSATIQLHNKGKYRNGKREGLWVFFDDTGVKRFEPMKPSLEDPNCVFCNDEGSGIYRNGKKVSD